MTLPPSPRHDASGPAWGAVDKYRILFDSIDEGFCVIRMVFDTQGLPIDYVFLEANPSFARQTGLTDAVGRRMRELAPSHEEHWFQIYGDVARTGESRRFEAHAEALQRTYDVFAFRVGDPWEHLVGVLFNDVSQRKRSERALRETDRRKDEFLAILAHELRNPLAPLRSGLHVMGMAAGQPEVLERTRLMMVRQVDHLVALVDQLLDVSRISRGLVALDLAPADLVQVIHQALEGVEPAVRERGHVLALSVPPGPVMVSLDAVRMAQVLSNLLLNGAKFTPPGGRLSLALDVVDGDAVVSVSDSGVGIPQERLSDVFEPFTQLPSSVRQSSGGLGIGLALVKQLVELHHGEVTAESAGLGQGSRFTVRLPLCPLTSPAQAAGATSAVATAASRRVLVADDNADAAESLMLLIEAMGHEVRMVTDGEQAVAEASRFLPDVVLLDLGMPRLDGFGAARQIRALPTGPDMRLVAVTGWGMGDDRAATREAGFDIHLVKPITTDQLDDVLR